MAGSPAMASQANVASQPPAAPQPQLQQQQPRRKPGGSGSKRPQQPQGPQGTAAGPQQQATRRSGAGSGPSSESWAQQQRNKALNRQISAAAEGGLQTLLELAKARVHDMNGINLATAFHRVAKLAAGEGADAGGLAAIRRHPGFQELLGAILNHVLNHSLRGSQDGQAAAPGEMPVQCLSIVAWSCAMLQVRHRPAFGAIAGISAPRLEELKPYELANLLWACAKVAVAPAELLRAAVAQLLRRQEGVYKVQCLSTVAWAFATLKRRSPVLFESLALELSRRAGELKPQEMSNTLWAFAKTRCANATLFRALGDMAASGSMAWQFKPQELSNTAWAFASVGLRHPALFARLAAVAAKRHHDLEPQNLANILWAFAKLRAQPMKELFPILLKASLNQLPQHKPQELSAIVWAAAQICPEQHPEFFSAAAAACAARAGEFSCNGLANLAKALCAVPLAAPALLLELLRAALLRLQSFQPQALIALLQGATGALAQPGYAVCAEGVWEVLAAILQHLPSRIPGFQPADLRDLADALAAHPATSTDGLVDTVRRARQQLALGKQGQSFASASTSAEVSQDEEDELYFPAGELQEVSDRASASSGASEGSAFSPHLGPADTQLASGSGSDLFGEIAVLGRGNLDGGAFGVNGPLDVQWSGGAMPAWGEALTIKKAPGLTSPLLGASLGGEPMKVMPSSMQPMFLQVPQFAR